MQACEVEESTVRVLTFCVVIDFINKTKSIDKNISVMITDDLWQLHVTCYKN
jgi:hypothetical protein